MFLNGITNKQIIYLSALHYAVDNDDLDIALLLLERDDVDINAATIKKLYNLMIFFTHN